jgi:hypothetical protein
MFRSQAREKKTKQNEMEPNKVELAHEYGGDLLDFMKQYRCGK